MRPDSFADRLLLVLGRRAPAYRWTVPASGLWATVAATMGRGPDGVLPQKSDTRTAVPAAVPVPRRQVGPRPRSAWPVQDWRRAVPLRTRRGLGWGVATATLVTVVGAAAFTTVEYAGPPPGDGAARPTEPGDVLGTRTLTIEAGQSVYLGLGRSRPSHLPSADIADLRADLTSDGLALVPLNTNVMVGPLHVAGPTYPSCRTGTPVARVVVGQATSFCLFGVTAVAVIAAAPTSPTQVSLQVVLYQN